LLISGLPDARGRAGPCRARQEAHEIAGGERGSGTRVDASGLSAGITIVAGILLGTGLGFGLGSLIGLTTVLALAGAAAGLAFGFYAVYVRFFREPPR
jgi:hypothetical protein